MYRVVTRYRDGGPRPVVERGPWHAEENIVNYWADSLRALGYVVEIEDQDNVGGAGGSNDKKKAKDDNADLAAALAAMA